MLVILLTQGSFISTSAVLPEDPAVIITPAIARFSVAQCTLEWTVEYKY